MTDTKTQIQRHATIQRAAINEADRTVSVLIATPTPVPTMRYIKGSGYVNCNEVLQCTPEAIDATRLDGGISVLMDHCWDDVVGVTVSHTIDPDGIRAVIRFTRDPASEPIWQDIVDGIRRHVSIGAEIIAQSYDLATNTNTITRWQPYEVSFVAVPADTNSGVGRSKQPIQSTPQQPQITMNTPTPQPTNHAQEIARLAELLGEQEEGIRALKEPDMTGTKFAERMQAKRAQSPLPAGSGGAKERQYSVANVLRYLAGDKSVDVGYELDVTRKIGTVTRDNSFLIPRSALGVKRSFNATTGAGLIDVQNRHDLHIEALRAEYIMAAMGVMELNDLTGDVVMPKTTGKATHYWIAPGQNPVQSGITVGQVPLNRKRVAAYVDVDYGLMRAAVDAEQFAILELEKAILGGTQQGLISGTGDDGQPFGILSSGITPVVNGGANGAAPDFQKLLQLEASVAIANARVKGIGAYLMSPRAELFLKGTYKAPEKNSATYLWENDMVNGYKAFSTTDVPDTPVPQTTNFLTDIIYIGNPKDIAVGYWGAIEVFPHPVNESGLMRIVAIQNMAVAFRNDSSIAVFKNALV